MTAASGFASGPVAKQPPLRSGSGHSQPAPRGDPQRDELMALFPELAENTA